jgi:phage N-6-adenine-methyltransferase
VTLIGFKGQNHPQQVAVRGANDLVDDRGTAPDTFAECVDRWGPFTLDVAAAPYNAKCEEFYTQQDNGLVLPWFGRVWCNPPYSDLSGWMEKVWAEWRRSPTLDSPRVPTSITLLLPANRPEQVWWQDYIEPFRDRPGSPMTTHFLRRRRRFIQPGATEIKPNERPPFGSVVVHLEQP